MKFNIGQLFVQFCIVTLFTLMIFGCSTKNIEGTNIEDSDESRDVIRTIETYRKAMESRDADMLIALSSKNYFEKNGDSNSKNNYDYKGLVKFLRSAEFRGVTDLRMTIVYKSLEFNDDRNVVTVRYHYSCDFKMPPPAYNETEAKAEENEVEGNEDNFDKEVWHSKNDDNEMVLELEGDKWQILKGM